MSEKRKLILLGAGGYAKSVLDSIDTNRYDFIGFIDGFKPIGTLHLGYPILANDIDNLNNRNGYIYFVSIGDNWVRKEKYNKLNDRGCEVVTIIDKSAIISNYSSIGKGVFVGKMAIINSGVIVGDNTILNTKSLVEHGCKIGSHCNISTNTTLNGDVIVEDQCFIGSASVVLGQLRIMYNSIVGAGSVVLRNVESNNIVAGAPAKLIKRVN